jgi:hypothetical protein
MRERGRCGRCGCGHSVRAGRAVGRHRAHRPTRVMSKKKNSTLRVHGQHSFFYSGSETGAGVVCGRPASPNSNASCTGSIACI